MVETEREYCSLIVWRWRQ